MSAFGRNSPVRLGRDGPVRFGRNGRQRFIGLGAIATGVVCPCHFLIGAIGLMMGGQVLTPAAQDGVHAVYVPIAVLVGAVLLGKNTLEGQKSRNGASEVQGE